MNKEVLIVLGSANSPSGVLCDLSLSRLDYCLTQYRNGVKILCTGGWGPNFNVSTESHASYAKKYLINEGVQKIDLLKSALSKNTVDDAVKIKPIVSNLSNVKLAVITSDYHLERVTLIFKEILKNYEITFVGVESNLDKEKLDSLLMHEKAAIESILKNGLYYTLLP